MMLEELKKSMCEQKPFAHKAWICDAYLGQRERHRP